MSMEMPRGAGKSDHLPQFLGAAAGLACGAMLVVLAAMGGPVERAHVCPDRAVHSVPLHSVGLGVSGEGASFYENFSFGVEPGFTYSVGPQTLTNRSAANGTDPAATAVLWWAETPLPALAVCTGAGGFSACSANREGWYVVLTDDTGAWLASYPTTDRHWNEAPGSSWMATNITVVSPSNLNATGDAIAFTPQGWGGCGSYVVWTGTL